MITGDNALTGCSIAFKCKMADPRKKMIILDYDFKSDSLLLQEFQYDKAEQAETHEEGDVGMNEGDVGMEEEHNNKMSIKY